MNNTESAVKMDKKSVQLKINVEACSLKKILPTEKHTSKYSVSTLDSGLTTTKKLYKSNEADAEGQTTLSPSKYEHKLTPSED